MHSVALVAIILGMSSCTTYVIHGFSPVASDRIRRKVISSSESLASTVVVALQSQNAPSQFDSSRRHALSSFLLLLGGPSLVASAAVTDETESFANTGFDSAYRGLSKPYGDDGKVTSPTTTNIKQSSASTSDEVSFTVSKIDLSKGLGLELGQVEFRSKTRVYVKYVEPGSVADKLGIRKDFVVVSINGESAERTNAEGVAIMVYRASQSLKADSDTLEIRFRDPTLFQSQLKNLQEGSQVTTQVAPAGDTTLRNPDGSVKRGEAIKSQEDQRLTVTQLIAPKLCNRPAQTDDLLEISYLGTVVDTGAVFDGSAIRINGEAIPGRGNDVSLFFVLGKQPFGQFPPGWDVGIQGMCVGERRRIIVPPVLGYGSVGLPRRGVPPDATLQYDVTLVSVNGLALPQ